MTTFRFKDLDIGETFDWIGGAYPSYFAPCVKITTRKYQARVNNGWVTHRVGTISADVFHVGEHDDILLPS